MSAKCCECARPAGFRSTLIGAPVCSAACSSAHGLKRSGADGLAFVGAESEVAAVLRAWPALLRAGEGRAVAGGHVLAQSIAHPIASMVKAIGMQRPGESYADYIARLRKEAREREAARERARRDREAAAEDAQASKRVLVGPYETPLATSPAQMTLQQAAATTTLATATGPQSDATTLTTAPSERTYFEADVLPTDVAVMLVRFATDFKAAIAIAAQTNYNARVLQEVARRVDIMTPASLGALPDGVYEQFVREVFVIQEEGDDRLTTFAEQLLRWTSKYLAGEDTTPGPSYARVVLFLQAFLERNPGEALVIILNFVRIWDEFVGAFTAIPLMVAMTRAGERAPRLGEYLDRQQHRRVWRIITYGFVECVHWLMDTPPAGRIPYLPYTEYMATVLEPTMKRLRFAPLAQRPRDMTRADLVEAVEAFLVLYPSQMERTLIEIARDQDTNRGFASGDNNTLMHILSSNSLMGRLRDPRAQRILAEYISRLESAGIARPY